MKKSVRNPLENRAKTIVAPCPLPCLLGARKVPSGAFTPTNLKLTKYERHTNFLSPTISYYVRFLY